MFISTAINRDIATINLEGRFTFADHAGFRKVSREIIDGSCNFIEIDFAKVDSLDSAAQGMLLMAREVARSQGKSISLVNCGSETKHVLQLSSFDKLFEIR